MKVYIADQFKINVYSLPDKIEDEFIINYNSSLGIEETITLTANNDSWNISSNYSTDVYDSVVKITSKALKDNDSYKIKFSDLEETVSLYSFDVPITYYNFNINNVNELNIGNNETCDIFYNMPTFGESAFKIYKYNGYWVLDDLQHTNSYIYVNKKRVHKCYLRLGDVIFSNGLKIIWMNNYLSINNPNNLVRTRLQPYKKFELVGNENKFTPVKDTEKNTTLYSEKQVFFHTPRLRNKIKETVINIEKPPEKQQRDEMPAFLTYGTSIVMGLSSSLTGIIAVINVVSGKATLLSSLTEIAICISMLIGMMMLPILQDKYRKRREKQKEEKRQKRYGEYLNSKREEIKNELKNEIEILFKNNLNANELQNAIAKMTSDVWCREISEDDFLSLRLGLGKKEASIKVQVTLEEFSLEDDNLREEVNKIKNEKLYLDNVPITISLVENNILPIIISDDYLYKKQYMDWLSLQIISYYSGIDLKIAIFTTEENKDNWDFYKYLPHCYNTDHSMRLFATNEDEYKDIALYIDEQYNMRKRAFNRNEDSIDNNTDDEKNTSTTDKYKMFDQYFLIITDNYLGIKNYEIIDKIMEGSNYGFSLLIIENTMSMIPSKCKCFIDINQQSCTIYNKEERQQGQLTFIPEFFTQDINVYSRLLANIPALSLKTVLSLPSSYNFLEMYKVGKIEQLNIVNRWINNDPTQSLNTSIGIKEDGKLMKIDLHEKYHGPHGLIAGSTGSGKSEFIITFILSMAINYHPYEVQFILIDYKGGGLAGAFENKITGVRLPHLVGTITNLDTNEMNRTLVSINSELKRREHIFNQARDQLGESTVDIYKYQKFYREGKVKEPVSHLFIISDEFAELKQQQPDFMQELVSTARIGRSLGVHLILATQKPSGVVDDQIWSNAKFKICLKVQTREDSIEMLKRPEAAAIKETGRFYLQVGYNELFVLAQSAWAGARYNPTDRILKSYDDSIDFIDNNGNIIKKVSDKIKEDNTKDYGDQLTNIVRFLNDVSKRENIKTKSLWLPSMPDVIYISDLMKKYNYQYTPYKINPIIGEYDVPSKQLQDILTIDLTNSGNVMIVGNPGSGKENMLSTLIYSTALCHTPDEVNFFIFDFGAETLKIFNKFPHVADVVLIDEKEKIKSGLLFFERQLATRKEKFSEYGGTYSSYINSNQTKLPLFVVIINGYDSLVERHPEYADYLTHLFRDAYKYGIVFIVTGAAVTSISSSVQQSFANKIATQLTDNFDYKFIFKAPYGLIPAKYFGRGIITINEEGYEFQTAYIYKKSEISSAINNLATTLREKYEKIKGIPIIPLKVTTDTLSQYIEKLSSVPLGIDVKTGDVVRHNFEKNNLLQIIGNKLLYNTSFINNLISALKLTSGCNLKIIDFAETGIDTTDVSYITTEYTKAINGILVDNKNSKVKTVYMFLGVSKIYDLVLDEGVAMFNKIISEITNIKNCSIILADDYPAYKKICKENWYNNTKMTTLWLGEDIKIQNVVNSEKVNLSDASEDFTGLGYYMKDNDYNVIKTIGVNGEK